jgi:glutaredoxin
MPETLEIFGKPGCHLCEAVIQAAMRVRERHAFELVLRNIEADAYEFHAQYRELIPVVLLNGREIARYRISEAELIRALQQASRGSET